MTDRTTDRTARLCSDAHRAAIALLSSFALPLVLKGLAHLLLPTIASDRATTVVLCLVGWNTFVATYVLLTSRTFAHVDSDEFRRRMALRASRRPWVWRALLRDGDGPSFTIESTAVAFAVVLVLPHVPGIAIDAWLLVPLSTTILLSCWALGVYAYALHYAQHDLDTPSLQFPGDRTAAFPDYLYFSIAVSTTFGTTDIDITSPRMRRVVNVHTLLTFLYNSVIVALLVSLLVR